MGLNSTTCSNAAAPLVIDTYDGSDQATHPSVVYAPDGWNGYTYWMGFTPYPGINIDYENPSVLASNDGSTWVVPDGLTNPLRSKPVGGFNADPELFFSSDGVTLWMIYRKRVSGADTLQALSSTDGVTWSADTQITTGAQDTSNSPAVIWDGTQYVMWCVNYTAKKLQKRTCATPDGTWSAASDCIMSIPTPSAMGAIHLWHLCITKDGTMYRALAQVSTSTGMPGELYYAQSLDGWFWAVSNNPILPRGANGAWDAYTVYRATMVKRTDGDYDVWYGGFNNNTQYIAKIGRTVLEL